MGGGGVHLVVDISNTPGNPLYANEPTGADSQHWTMVPDPMGSGYFFFQSQWKNAMGQNVVIDIQGGSNAAGTPLDAFPQKSENYNNQLWLPVANASTPNYVFIQSWLKDPGGLPLVVDIENNSTSAGTPLDAYAMKSSNNNNQLWQLVSM